MYRLFIKLVIFTNFFFGNILYSQTEEKNSIIYHKDKKELQFIGKKILYLEDKTNSLSMEDLLKPEIQSQFQPNHKEIFVKRPSTSAFWFKISVSNPEDSNLYIEFSGTNFWELDYYIPNGNNFILESKLGLLRLHENNDFLSPHNWFAVPKSIEPVTVYIRFYTQRPITVSTYLGTIPTLLKKKAREDYLTAWFLGAVMVMFVYNLFLFIIIKDRIYFWYICYVFAGVLLILHSNNFSVINFVFDSNTAFFLNTHPFSWMSLGYIFSGIFSIEFLKLAQKKFLLGVVTLTSIIFPSIIMLLDTFSILPHSSLVPFFQIIGTISLFSMFLISLYLWQKEKNKNARFYCLGWFWILASAIVFYLVVNGFIEYTFLGRNINYLGIVLETLFFSLALGDRINTLKEENFHILKDQNETLEQRVTERTKELQNLNAQFKRISDNMPGALFEYLAEEKDGLTGYLTFLSSGVQELFEISQKDIMKNSSLFWDLIHPGDIERVITINTKCNLTGEPYSLETRIITPSGKIKWIQLIARSIPANENRNYLWSGVLFDISDRKLNERNLLLLSTALEKAANGVFISDHKGKIQWVNSAFLNITGYSAEEVIGQNPEFLNSDAYTKDFYKEMWAYLLSGKTWSNTMLNKRKDGTFYYDEQTNTPIFDEYGQVSHFISIRQDVTNRIEYEREIKLAKEKAESASRAKTEFLANMSHEIRTPINSILGFSELLCSQLKEDKFIYYANSISINGKILLQLINDFLDLSKIESGRIELDYKPIKINQILDEMRIIFTHKIEQKKIHFYTEIHPKIPPILHLDETRIRQVLLNLIGNAIKFTDNGYVKVSIDGDFEKDFLNLIIRIEDTGIGISKNEHERIFESFVQAQGQDTSKYGGTGLGLPICKKLIHLMNGEIRVESEIGQGSTFIVSLDHVQFPKESLDKSERLADPLSDSSNLHLSNSDTIQETQAKPTLDDTLSKILKEEKRKKWEEISEVIIINDTIEFAKEIYDLALEHNCSELQSWAESLELSCTQYDIENINYMLSNFSHFLE